MKKRALSLLLGLLLTMTVGCTVDDWDETGQFTELSDYYKSENEELSPELTAFTLAYYIGHTIDPITCDDGAHQILGALLYESLYQLDRSFEPLPVLAGEYSYDSETFTYTIPVRYGVTFSDGSALTSQDVADTLKRAAQSERYGQRFANVREIAAAGDGVTIRLNQDNRRFISRLNIPIVKSGTEQDVVPLGTGPYVWSQGEGEAYLERNADWWQEKETPLERIALRGYKARDSVAYAFSARDVQMLVSDLTGTGAPAISGGGETTDAPTAVMQYIAFNPYRPYVADSAIRQALSAAIDRNELVAVYLLGHGSAAAYPVSPYSAQYPREQQNPDGDVYPDRLTAVGLNTGEQQIELRMLVNEENPFKLAMARQTAEDMTAGDVTVTVTAVPWADFTLALDGGEGDYNIWDFDMYYGECRLTADWDVTQLVGTGGALNPFAYGDEHLDDLLKAYLAADAGDVSGAADALYQEFARQMPIAPICFKSTSVLVSAETVEGLTPTDADPFFGMENWEIHLATDGELSSVP